MLSKYPEVGTHLEKRKAAAPRKTGRLQREQNPQEESGQGGPGTWRTGLGMKELLGQAWKATPGLGQLHHESAFPTELELRQEAHPCTALVLPQTQTLNIVVLLYW